ncbi:hypothetical protein PHLCEN_2v8991 [Hermanssonia centrifuga]|uniref:Uncharacterized protein n=1 Tax=Hermanssonia centrifuga TaxID=98765 RepID=A0A2R6NS54_9APHY|nr:hypothetical protein PHLCEN_2v8991 [Hermanssonia centrifuga]
MRPLRTCHGGRKNVSYNTSQHDRLIIYAPYAPSKRPHALGHHVASEEHIDPPPTVKTLVQVALITAHDSLETWKKSASGVPDEAD